MAHRYKVAPDAPYPHFVTTSIVQWLPVFISGSYFKIVLDSLEYLRENRGLLIHAYVIMPTHMHAILTALQGDLSAIMRDFKKFTSRAIYQQAQEDGNRLMTWMFEKAAEKESRGRFKVWQDEFHPEAIFKKEFFQQKLDYIHANPARKGLAVEAGQWYYSSLLAYAEVGEPPLIVDPLEW